MCTMINLTAHVCGAGKGLNGWFPITEANIGFDHATHTQAEHALTLDFVNRELGLEARVAVEMNIASGKALLSQLQAAIQAAEASGAPE